VGSFFRRFRGIIGTGLTWAIGWAGVKVGLFGLYALLFGFPLRFFGTIALSGLVQGFIAGGAFAVVLSIAERRHTLEDLSAPRVALWGGIGAVLVLLPTLPVVLSHGLPLAAILVSLAADGLMGAGFATGSVALARRADNKLLPEVEDDPTRMLEGD
jgi:hypothetical protein